MFKVYDEFDSPIGKVRVVTCDGFLIKVELIEDHWISYIKNNSEIEKNKSACKFAVDQLKEYFSGERKIFTVPIHIEGTEFRKSVWASLQKIPYGEIRSYYDIAEDIGNVKAVRAVGQANKHNNIPIVIPCHRVISKNKQLVGFAGNNTHIQEILLKHENIWL